MSGSLFMSKENKKFKQDYVMFKYNELFSLLICILLDVSEYALPILLTPIIGDILDIIGIGIGLIMFGWIGLLSLLEFLPLVDIFPVFIFMWIIWYLLKKREEKQDLEKLKKEWK
jgi:hypothetical protein